MFKYLLAISALVLSLPATALDAAKEYEIKAAFLFNLGSFVTWPKANFANAPNFDICVQGNDPFGERLDVLTAGQKVAEYPVRIQRINEIQQALACEILFISNSEQLRVQSLVIQLKDRPVLTVGDMDNFVISGGMVQFYPRDNKIRLMIDPQAFANAGLKASAHLMRIAQVVNGK